MTVSRVARGDVVRLIRTGQVGVIRGWADHERLAQNGTILDVDLGGGQTVQANGRALDFVADAYRRVPVWRVWVGLILSAAGGGVITFDQQVNHGNPIWMAAGIGWLFVQALYGAWHSMLIRPRKTRITLPAKVVVRPGTRGVGRPPQG